MPTASLIEVGLAPSTVQGILRHEGLARLDRGDRSSGSQPKPRRYERDRPGKLVHVDVKKIAAIPPGGGWRMHGPAGRPRRIFAGYRYIHTALDDRSRLAYSEILDDGRRQLPPLSGPERFSGSSSRAS